MKIKGGALWVIVTQEGPHYLLHKKGPIAVACFEDQNMLSDIVSQSKI